jgi:hypothetical protein
MLTNAFTSADPQKVMEYLMHQQPDNGKTWLEFCRERNFTVDEMMRGFGRWQERAQTIEHEPIQTTATRNRVLAL